jgi:chemotaxis signal transduction protein
MSIREYVTFRIGEQLFGLSVTEIRDVFRPARMTPVPLSSLEIAGVLNLRGRIVTAIDARSRNADAITARLGVLQEEIRKARLIADHYSWDAIAASTVAVYATACR